MDEAKILATTYRDKGTIYRTMPYQDLNGETKQKEVLVFENIPCAISQSKNEVPERGNGSFQKVQEYVLFTMPDVSIKENDHAVIITELGEIYEGRTGKSFVYAGSHGETKIKAEGVAG